MKSSLDNGRLEPGVQATHDDVASTSLTEKHTGCEQKRVDQRRPHSKYSPGARTTIHYG